MKAEVTLTYNITVDSVDFSITDEDWETMDDSEFVTIAEAEAPFIGPADWVVYK